MKARLLLAGATMTLMAGGALMAAPGWNAPDQLVAGRHTFEKWCAPCHANQPRLAGTLALQNKYRGEVPAALEKRGDLTPDVVRYFVRNGVAWMAPFRKTEISDTELTALAAYLASPLDRRPRPVAPSAADVQGTDRPPPHG